MHQFGGECLPTSASDDEVLKKKGMAIILQPTTVGNIYWVLSIYQILS